MHYKCPIVVLSLSHNYVAYKLISNELDCSKAIIITRKFAMYQNRMGDPE